MPEEPVRVRRARIEAGTLRDTGVPVVGISVAAPDRAGQRFLESLGHEPRRVLMSLTPSS